MHTNWRVFKSISYKVRMLLFESLIFISFKWVLLWPLKSIYTVHIALIDFLSSSRLRLEGAAINAIERCQFNFTKSKTWVLSLKCRKTNWQLQNLRCHKCISEIICYNMQKCLFFTWNLLHFLWNILIFPQLSSHSIVFFKHTHVCICILMSPKLRAYT